MQGDKLLLRLLHLVTIIDNNKKVSGKWVKIKGRENDEFFEEGYVFNGFLTDKKIEAPLKIPFEAFTVFVDKLAAHSQIIEEDSTENSMAYYIDLGTTPPSEPEFVGFSGSSSRLDVDNSDSASSILFNQNGDYVFVTLQGN